MKFLRKFFDVDQGGMGGGSPSVVNPEAGYLNAEARRTINPANFSANSVQSVELPRDTVLKRLAMRLTARFSVTYAAGSPVVAEFGFFEAMCPQAEVIVNGNRVIKSVRPHLMRLHGMLIGGEAPRRATTTSAAVATSTRASREFVAGTLAYPATTEFFLVNEQIPMSFELPWGYAGSRYDTELDIRDVSSAYLKFYFGSMDTIQQFGVGASVTYGAINASISTQIVENRARPRPVNGQVLYDYVESTTSSTFTSAGRSKQIELQTGNYLAALGIQVRNGDTNKLFAENLVTNLALKINGSTAIQGPVDHQQLQDDNKARFGINDDLGFSSYLATIASVASAHPMKGFAFMNLLRNGDWNTAINTSRGALVDRCTLEFDTPASSGDDAATYTNGLDVIVHTHEIRPFVYQK